MVECAASLPPGELTKFENWMICPSGEPAKDAMDVSVLGTALDEERLDMLRVTIAEEEDVSYTVFSSSLPPSGRSSGC